MKELNATITKKQNSLRLVVLGSFPKRMSKLYQLEINGAEINAPRN